MVNSEEVTGTREYMTLWTRCCINQRCYNRVWLYLQDEGFMLSLCWGQIEWM